MVKDHPFKERPPARDRDFLGWAKRRGGICCVCASRGLIGNFDELHHFGPRAMSKKCSDYQVARVCRRCHEEVQGKTSMSFHATGNYELWCALLRDSNALLGAYIEETR